MSDITVRYVTADDKKNWIEIWHCFRANYDKSIPNGLADSNYTKFLDPKTPMWSGIALDKSKNNAVVGMVNFLSTPSTWNLEDIVYLNDLFVDSNTRGKGIGRKLIEFVYQEADKMGTPYVHWTTDYHNHTAQLLYTKVARLTPKLKYERVIKPENDPLTKN